MGARASQQQVHTTDSPQTLPLPTARPWCNGCMSLSEVVAISPAGAPVAFQSKVPERPAVDALRAHWLL